MGTLGRCVRSTNLKALTILICIFCQQIDRFPLDWILACHINGMFLKFPSNSKRTSNLQIVMIDHICESTVAGKELDSLGKLEVA